MPDLSGISPCFDPTQSRRTQNITLGTCPQGQVTDAAVTCPRRDCAQALRNLSLGLGQTSLYSMWPHSLLFSSDEEASRALSHAFRDLEFEVETCPEIFSAVEKITSRRFDVVVSDWNEGLEAVFLLKTVRELKANHSAFTVAIAGAEAANAARDAGADLVLSRPIVPDEVKYALLTCDPFLAQMKTWLPRLGPTTVEITAARQAPPKPGRENKSAENKSAESKNSEAKVLDPLPRLRAWPSPSPPSRNVLRRSSPPNRFLTTICCIDREYKPCSKRPSPVFRRRRFLNKGVRAGYCRAWRLQWPFFP